MMNNFEIKKPFGPSVVKVTLNEDIIKSMNDYVESIIKNEKKSKALDHGHKLAGNVNQEFLLEDEFMIKIKWAELLAGVVQKWILNQTGKQLKQFTIIKSWIVRQFKNEYNPIHYHSGDISGVGYLKVPADMGKTSQNEKVNENGNLVLIHGTKQFLSNSIIKIKPKIGDFYFFPNYLMHTVYPFSETNEERRSVSFNATLDKDTTLFI